MIIRRIYRRVNNEIYYLKKYYSDKKRARESRVKFFNFWPTSASDNWFYKFMETRGYFKKYPDLTISFFSVYGPKYLIDLNRSDIKIMYNAENVFRQLYRFMQYQDLAMSKVDLAMGFRDLSSPNYLRFPLWVMHMFKPDSTEEDIRKRCEKFTNQKISHKKRFSVHVSRHDDALEIRSRIIKKLSSIERVDCAGSFMNNTNELKMKFGDNKIEYLKNYKFNICPENTDNRYYVTEKLAHAIMAGCIPVYWGANGNPEPEIFNQDAIIYWNGDGSVEKIKELHQSDIKFKEFAGQPRLQPGAADLIIEMFKNFENWLDRLFERNL